MLFCSRAGEGVSNTLQILVDEEKIAIFFGIFLV